MCVLGEVLRKLFTARGHVVKKIGDHSSTGCSYVYTPFESTFLVLTVTIFLIGYIYLYTVISFYSAQVNLHPT